MDENKILEACFSLAHDLMWEKDTAPIEQLPNDISELNEMTTKFVEIVKDRYFQVEDLPDGEAILLGAIHYLNIQAIPPLRGNYDWFYNSLSTLLEICNPNIRVTNNEVPFILSLQKGITKYLEDAVQSNNSEEETDH